MLCHPERSKALGEAESHAESKDPMPANTTAAKQGVLTSPLFLLLTCLAPYGQLHRGNALLCSSSSMGARGPSTARGLHFV